MGFARKKYWTSGSEPPDTFAGEEALVDAATTKLRIDLKGVDGQLPDVLRERVLRRLLLTLTRFGPRIRKVTVRLDELPNPLGGVDRRCRLRAQMQGSEDVATDAIDEGFEDAVAKTVALLAQRIDLVVQADAERRGSTPGARRDPDHRRRSK